MRLAKEEGHASLPSVGEFARLPKSISAEDYALTNSATRACYHAPTSSSVKAEVEEEETFQEPQGRGPTPGSPPEAMPSPTGKPGLCIAHMVNDQEFGKSHYSDPKPPKACIGMSCVHQLRHDMVH